MSAARLALVNSPNLFFKIPEARTDLLNEDLTNTYLIELLSNLVIKQGWMYELTMVRTGHHDDGPHGHWGGFASDGWPLSGRKAGAWMDATDPRFASFLRNVAGQRDLYQAGLAGSADIPANRRALGQFYFPDTGADHIHIGATDGTFYWKGN